MANYNMNSGYGQALQNYVATQVPTFGRLFVLMNSSNTDEENYDRIQNVFPPDPAGQIRFYTSLASVEAAMESNNNDVCLIDSNSSHAHATGLALSESRKHFIGMDGGDRLVQQGAKIVSTVAGATAYLLKNTGTRNTFRNIKFIQQDTNAAAIHVLEEGGEGSLYKNCSFTFGVVDNLDLTTASEIVCGADSMTMVNCLVGTETLLTSAARSVFAIDQVTSSQEFKSNIIKDTNFLISSSSATAELVTVVAATDVLFTNLFDGCNFMASVDSAGGAAITNAVQSIGSLVKGTVNFKNCVSFNCTNFCDTLTANFMTYGPETNAAAGEAGTPS